MKLNYHTINLPMIRQVLIDIIDGTSISELVNYPDLAKSFVTAIEQSDQATKAKFDAIRAKKSDPPPQELLAVISDEKQQQIKDHVKSHVRSILNSDLISFASSLTAYDSYQFNEQGQLLAIKYIVFRIHYAIDHSYIVKQRRIYSLRKDIEKKHAKHEECQDQLTELTKIIQEGMYKDYELLELFCFYKVVCEYLTTARSMCYSIKEGKTKHFVSQHRLGELLCSIQLGLQFNQSFKSGPYNPANVTIENRQTYPQGSKENQKLNTVGHFCNVVTNYTNFIKIAYNGSINSGLKRVAFYDGQTYQTSNTKLLEFNGLLAKMNETEYNDENSKVLSDQCVKQLNYMNPSINTLPKAGTNYIPLLNGILDFNKDDPASSKLLGFSPDIITTNQLQANYIEGFKYDETNPQYKKIDDYFDYISGRYTPNLADHYQDVKTRLIESLSLALTRSQEFKKFVYLHGKSDSGKTRLISNVLSSLFDVVNYTTKDLFELDVKENKFEIATLADTSLLLIDEGSNEKNQGINKFSKLDLGAIGDNIKKLLGGSLIEGQEKNVQSKVRFFPEMRLYMTSNHYINFEDPTVLDKMVYIPMNADCKSQEAQKYFLDQSQETNDALFMYLLRGLMQVYTNSKEKGYYITPSEYIDSIQKRAKVSIPYYQTVKDWIEEYEENGQIPPTQGGSINAATLPQFQVKYYWDKFKESAYKDECSKPHFERAFLDILGCHKLTDQRVIEGSNSQFSIFIPRQYSSYKEYKQNLDPRKKTNRYEQGGLNTTAY